jgi:hypothetical protein
MRTKRLLTTAAAIALASAATTGLAGCSGSGAPTPGGVITMTDSSCGGPWQAPGPGWHTFEVRNGNTAGGEIDLINPRTGGIYSEISGFGANTNTPMRIDVGSGQYAFRCLFQDADPMTGPVVTVAGHTAGTPAIPPVSYNDLTSPAKAYQNYVEAGLKTLNGRVTALANDVGGGDLGKARSDWLTAHLEYETLGAAYGTFGRYEDEIDMRADATGVGSPQWTGFYRIEYGLWHGQSAAELTAVTNRLHANVAALLAGWPAQEINLPDIGLRTHEILENALQFQLTGHDDYGSGTTLATTLANVRGTYELLSLLRPLLTPRYPGLPAAYEWLGRLRNLLEKQAGPGRPVTSLPPASREDIVAACDQALEELAPIASITEPRNT